jgi:hypothetical protein
VAHRLPGSPLHAVRWYTVNCRLCLAGGTVTSYLAARCKLSAGPLLAPPLPLSSVMTSTTGAALQLLPSDSHSQVRKYTFYKKKFTLTRAILHNILNLICLFQIATPNYKRF